MGKPVGEWMIKGKTIDEHGKSEQGRGLLKWIINQPDDGKKTSQIKREYIENLLIGHLEPAKPETPKRDDTGILLVLGAIQTKVEKILGILEGKKSPQGEEVWDE